MTDLYLAIPNNQEPIILSKISEDEFNAIKCDSEKIYEYLYYVRRLQEIQLNKDNFFDTINSYVTKFKDSKNQTADFKENAFVDINRCVINFVASFVSFIEHCEAKIIKLYGANSEQLIDFKNYESGLYDKYFSYRFLKRIRNYAIHAYYPVDFVAFDSRYDNISKTQIFELEVLCSRDRLLSSKTFKKKLGKDLKTLDSKFEIADHMIEVEKLIKPLLNCFIKIAKTEFIESAQRLVNLSCSNNQPELSISMMRIESDYVTKHDSKILPIEISKQLIEMIKN